MADPYAVEFDSLQQRVRSEFYIGSMLGSRNAHAVITGVTETAWTEDDLRRARALFVTIAADRRLLSRWNAGVRELERDRRRR